MSPKPAKFGLLLIAVLLAFLGSSIFASGVEPLLFDLSGKPGETLNFKVTIQPSDKPGNIKLSLLRVQQKLDGNVEYLPVKPEDYSPAGWVGYPSKVSVVPGKSTEISGTIKLPMEAKGTSHLLLIVEPENEIKNVDGLSLKVRYGVTLNVQVDRPGIRPSAVVTDFNMVKSQKGYATIQAKVKNNSSVDFKSYAYATVRNMQKKLIEKIELLPYSYMENNLGDPIIFPGSEVLYLGVVHANLSPGQYEVRLFYRFAETGQIFQSKTVNVQSGEYKFPEAKFANVKISPEDLSFEGKPGALTIKAIKFENKTDKPLVVQLTPTDIEPKYAFSIFTNTKVEIKNGSQFIINPKQMAVKIVTVSFPKDTPIRGNYGNLKVQIFSQSEKPVLVEEFDVSMAASVIGNKKRLLEVKNISGELNGDNYLFSAIVKNTGNTLISPAITMLLKDDQDRAVVNTNLNCDGEENISILPDRMATVTSTLPNIKPGKYQVEIKAVEGNSILAKQEYTIQIK